IPPSALHAFAERTTEIDEAEEGSSEFNANSSDQIATLLFDLLGIGVGKNLKRTATGRISTGKRQLELCRAENPVVGKGLQYRERSKLKSTYADSLPGRARLHPRGACCPICGLHHEVTTARVHTTFPTTRADTGRLSSKGPNLQQIPIRTTLGQQIRAAFVAP